ncbi:MAG TPA: Ku protein [Solirubrobacterales bacterium]|nr:Ku protein [Solirubrobacterales bacterium]
MAPRSIWNGTVTFGMVNVPVKLYSATESKTVHFHEVHRRDGARVEHRKICPKDEKEVPNDEIVKGYETSPDKYVILEKEEIKAAAGDRGKVIHLEEFVERESIDPVFYEKTYYVGSRDDEDLYRLLFEALKKTGRAGVGRFTFHDREYLVTLRALDDLLALDTLRFHDEVVEAKELDTPSAQRKTSPKEKEMASRLVEMMHTDFDPTEYEDTYRDSVLDLIKRKAKGEEIDLVGEEEPEHGDDLSAALEASLGGKG